MRFEAKHQDIKAFDSMLNFINLPKAVCRLASVIQAIEAHGDNRARLMGPSLESTEDEFINTIFAHPTLSESIHESVLSAFDKPLHF